MLSLANEQKIVNQGKYLSNCARFHVVTIYIAKTKIYFIRQREYPSLHFYKLLLLTKVTFFKEV